ncbi:hypothetical protein [Brevibacillus gelatini]
MLLAQYAQLSFPLLRLPKNIETQHVHSQVVCGVHVDSESAHRRADVDRILAQLMLHAFQAQPAASSGYYQQDVRVRKLLAEAFMLISFHPGNIAKLENDIRHHMLSKLPKQGLSIAHHSSHLLPS